MRRSDSPSRFGWVARTRCPAARLAWPLLAGIALAPTPAAAQIAGEQSPGTPGLIDGELRAPRNAAFPPPATERSLAAEPPRGSQRFALRRTPNAAIRRGPAGTGATAPLQPGASPMGRSLSETSRRPRRPGELSGQPFPDPAIPAIGRAADLPPAPGLQPLAPTRRRSPTVEQDPYAPVGLRLGTMIVRPALEIAGGYDTNAGRASTRAKASPVYRTEGELVASSDWTRHRLDISLRGSFTGYTALSAANRPEGDARIALRLDASRDLTFDAEARSRVDTELASAADAPAGVSGRTPLFTQNLALGATQRFGRLSLGLRGNLDRTDYADAQSTAGTAIDQSTRNFTGYGLRLRAGFEASPGFVPFVEAGIDRRAYDRAFDSAGFRRSSQGVSFRAGTTFELARTLTGEVSAGYFLRDYEDTRLPTLKAPFVDAQLTWSISPLTTLNLRAQSEIAETTIANSAGATVYRGTATLTHAFLRHLTATASFGIAQTSYDGINREETAYTGGIRLDYKFSRLMALRGSYQYEARSVNVPGENYAAHTFLLGMRFTP